MPIYRLAPLDLFDPRWILSREPGIAYVRASSLEDARRIVSDHFCPVDPAREPGGAPTPWCDESLVVAELVSDPRARDWGPPGLILVEPLTPTLGRPAPPPRRRA